MKIDIKQLKKQLQGALNTLYLLSGDEPLLQQDAQDLIVKAAKAHGFTGTQVFHYSTQFSWHDLSAACDNLSLFSDKTVIILHHPKASFDALGLATLTRYLESKSTDHLLIIKTAKLTSAQQKTKWFKQVTAHKSVYVPLWAVPAPALPQWLSEKARDLNLSLRKDVIHFIADQTEGHLLAAKQALEKISLYGKADLSIEDAKSIISDSARFTVYDLSQASLLGETQKVVKILSHISQDNKLQTLVLYSLTQDIRTLISLCTAQHHAERQSLLNKQWRNKKLAFEQAAKRCNKTYLYALLARAHIADLAIKGLSSDNAWRVLEQIAIALCTNTQVLTC